MENRNILTNTFEKGLDLDTDARLVSNDRLRNALNIDITKRGDSLVVTDLKGETILFNYEPAGTQLTKTLAAVSVNFLVEPTGETREAILVFYTITNFFSIYQFVVRALFLDNLSQEVILLEDMSEDDYNKLSTSSVDFGIVGKFGYDVVYFVDNRREPRKIDCIAYRTNENVMTLTLNSQSDEVGYKTVNLNLTSSMLPNDEFRCYVYMYKTGGPLVYLPINPNTDTVKYLDVNYSGSSVISFDVYPEDYGDLTFQIVYHRDGASVYRNFIIGNPYKVELSIGSTAEFIVGLRSTSNTSESNSVDSWEFLYNGNSFVGYIDTPTIEIGTTKLYLSEITIPENYVPDGYYQRADISNVFFRIETGVITEQAINNGDVSWTVVPAFIESAVRADAELIQEGNFDRLSSVNIHVPESVTVAGITYFFVNTVANPEIGREKISSANNFTYTIEYPEDINPVSNYSVGEAEIQAFIISVVKSGSEYILTARVTTTSMFSSVMSVSVHIQAFTSGSGVPATPVNGIVNIYPGQLYGDTTIFYNENFGVDTDFGPICISSYDYSGPETIITANAC